MPSLAFRIFKPAVRLINLMWMRTFYPVGYQRFFVDRVMPAMDFKKSPCACERITIDGMEAEWADPPGADKDRVLLYLHGGGWVVGSINAYKKVAGEIANVAGCRALVVDYRLAPEHKFPAALDDCVAAYRWLLSQGYHPENIVIAGDSAGGGLTASTLVALRDAGDPLPAAGMLLCPGTDLTLDGGTFISNARDDVMLNGNIARMWVDMYLGDTDPQDPLASPAFANLKGLPPLYIQIGSRELLLDNARQMAEAAQSYGVPVELEIFDGMFHVWQCFYDMIPEGRDAVDKLGKFCNEQMKARNAEKDQVKTEIA